MSKPNLSTRINITMSTTSNHYSGKDLLLVGVGFLALAVSVYAALTATHASNRVARLETQIDSYRDDQAVIAGAIDELYQNQEILADSVFQSQSE